MKIKEIITREVREQIISIKGVDDLHAAYGSKRQFAPRGVRLTWSRRRVFSPAGSTVSDWVLERQEVSGPSRLKSGGLGQQDVELRFYSYNLASWPDWLVELANSQAPGGE